MCVGETPGSPPQLRRHQRRQSDRPGHAHPQHDGDRQRQQSGGLGREVVSASQDCEAGPRLQSLQGHHHQAERGHHHLQLRQHHQARQVPHPHPQD